MSLIKLKINKLLQLELLCDDNDNFKLKILFKFNYHHSNWLYLNLNKCDVIKLKRCLKYV